MRKSIKKIITLCLAVMMLASVMCVSSFADDSTTALKSVKKYSNYTAIGDSISTGYGLAEYFDNIEDINDASKFTEEAGFKGSLHVRDGKPISTSYAGLVTSAVGADFSNLTRSGCTATLLRYIIDSDYYNESLKTADINDTTSEAFYDYIITSLTTTSVAEYVAQRDEFIEGIKNADAITINLGSNDTMTYGMYVMYMEQYKATVAVADMSLTDAEKEAYVENATIQGFIEGMTEGYKAFVSNFAQDIKIIYDLNPDVDLYVIGMYNPFADKPLNDDESITIGDAIDSFVGFLNTYMAVECPYASKYNYVDVMGTEVHDYSSISAVLNTDASDNFKGCFTYVVHPDEAGHKYMAEKILTSMNSFSSKLKSKINASLIDADANLDKINSQVESNINSVLDKMDSDTQSIKEKIASLMSGSSDTTATTASDSETALTDVSFNTTDHNAYVNGYDGNVFKPDNSITRAETAKMLYNLLSTATVEKYGTNTNTFSDVNSSSWYNTAVSTLAATGAISGYSDGTFKPNQSITRAEFVKMVMSIVGINSSATPSFNDTSSSAWYSPAVGTAQAAGYVEGSNGNFRPSDNMSRAEAVTFLNRVLGRTADTTYIGNHLDTVTSFTDVSVSSWYYKAVMEAANGHTYTVSSNTETWTAIK